MLILSLNACSYLSSVSTTSIPDSREHKVKAESYKFLFFAMNFSNDFVDEMAEDLAKKCPEGKVQGILTKHESIMYFPLIAHGINVSAEGYCVR